MSASRAVQCLWTLHQARTAHTDSAAQMTSQPGTEAKNRRVSQAIRVQASSGYQRSLLISMPAGTVAIMWAFSLRA